MPYTEQSPSRDTFERLFGILKTDYLEKCVIEQGRHILDLMNEKQIAIDGKRSVAQHREKRDRRATIY